MVGIKIKEIAIYHPENKVDNEFYLQHFNERGRDITNFLKAMGRQSRYIIDNKTENTLTMGIEAARKVIEKAGLHPEDIDMLVFSTQVPETTFPTNAVFLHDVIGLKPECFYFDSNASCAGMTMAVDNASRYMLSNSRIKRALVVGSDYNSLLANPEQEITYANYGDAAAALILERAEDEVGFIDSMFYGQTIHKDYIKYPIEGLAAATHSGDYHKHIEWLQFDANEAMPPAFRLIKNLLSENNLTVADIKAFCFSQFAHINIVRIQENLEIPNDKIVYIGDRFGYTGTSSPFIALHEGIADGRIQKDDLVVFWTVGAGYQLAAMLFKI